jgi:glutathione S-transferase
MMAVPLLPARRCSGAVARAASRRRAPRWQAQQQQRGSASAASSSVVPLDYYSAWFCPFAHRATLALEHHAPSGVEYTWIEALGWSKKDEEEVDANSGETLSHSWWYHWKHEDLLKHNPEHQLVPTLVQQDGRAVFESILCIEYVDELARSLSGASAGAAAAPWLLPDDLVDKAHARSWSERVNRTLCSYASPAPLSVLPSPCCPAALWCRSSLCSAGLRLFSVAVDSPLIADLSASTCYTTAVGHTTPSLCAASRQSAVPATSCSSRAWNAFPKSSKRPATPVC